MELQISLKNYDPQKDKRFSGTVRFDLLFDPTFSLCATSPVWKQSLLWHEIAAIIKVGEKNKKRQARGWHGEVLWVVWLSWPSPGWWKQGRRTPTLGLKTWGKALSGWAGKFMSSSRTIKPRVWLDIRHGMGKTLFGESWLGWCHRIYIVCSFWLFS